MNGWTSLEQVTGMAAEVMAEGVPETDVLVTLRRAVRDGTNRWTATVGKYSSKAARTPEEAIEEVASMFRSELLCRIEKAEERIRSARAALPVDVQPVAPEVDHGK